MRRVERLEILYLDFDGFFASVMQQAMPALRGRPVGVIPFDMKAVESTSRIARRKLAGYARRSFSCRSGRISCGRAQHALLNEIACVAPIDAVKSIDERAVVRCTRSRHHALDLELPC